MARRYLGSYTRIVYHIYTDPRYPTHKKKGEEALTTDAIHSFMQNIHGPSYHHIFMYSCIITSHGKGLSKHQNGHVPGLILAHNPPLITSNAPLAHELRPQAIVEANLVVIRGGVRPVPAAIPRDPLDAQPRPDVHRQRLHHEAVSGRDSHARQRIVGL